MLQTKPRHGGRCKAEAMPEAEWCWNYPDYAQARRRRASKGGKRGGRGRPQAELSDIKRRLSQRIAMTLTRMHANVMPCTVGTHFYGS